MQNRGRELRVLLAEDDDDMRQLVAQALRARGLRVLDVADGGALEQALLGNPGWDLVVSDIRLPMRSGLQVLREMRARGMVVPVIFMTAFSSADLRMQASGIGAVLLDKPFEMRTLLTLVESLTSTS